MKKIYRLLVILLTIFISVQVVQAEEICMDSANALNHTEINALGDSAKSTFFKISIKDTSDSERICYDGDKILYCADGTKDSPMSGLPTNAGIVEMDENCHIVTKNAKQISYVYENGYGTYKTGYSATNYLTGDYLKDYYITQAAIWYFTTPDSWMSNFNFTNGTFNGVSSDISQKISKLVNDANSAATAQGSLTVTPTTQNMKLTSDRKYYISDVITLTGTNLNSQISVTVSGANGAFATTDQNATSGSSTFSSGNKIYIKVPATSVTSNKTTIKMDASATTAKYDGTATECGHYNSSLQSVIIYYSGSGNDTLKGSTTLTINKYAVKISKEDITNSKEIEGAKLVVKNGSTVIDSWTSGTTPHSLYLDPGTYTLEETIAPAGYKKKTTTIEFTLDQNGKVYINNKEVSEVVMTNEPITILISKKDVTETEEIAGATLRILDKDGNVVKDVEENDLIWKSTSEPKKIHIAAGTYVLEETIAPDGYKKETTTIEFTVDDNGKVLIDEEEVSEVIMINELITVSISKRSVTGDNELPGAKLRILDAKGNVAKDINGKLLEWTSTSKHSVFNLIAGTYILEETIAPEGYELSEKTIKFTVTVEGKVLIDGKEVKDNLIIFENTPEPEPVPTGSTIVYVGIVLGIAALGFVIYIIIKKYKK